MPKPFGNWRQRLLAKSPVWLREGFGRKLVGLQGLLADAFSEGLFQAVKIPLIAASTSPNDALELAGKARNLERYPGESHEKYRARLLNAWHIWQYAGTFRGIEEQLYALGYGAYVLSVPRTWEHWSKFYVVIYDHPWKAEKWGEGSDSVWGGFGPSLWGIDGMSQDDLDAILAVIAKFKPGRWVCGWINITTGPCQLWGQPGDKWGEGCDAVWGMEGSPIRIPVFDKE